MNNIFCLNEKEKETLVSELGGKGASLVKLTKGGFRVPDGFIIKTSAFDEFILNCSLIEKIEKIEGDITQKCELIHNIFETAVLSDDLKNAIENMLNNVNSQSILPNPLLAIRSSGVTEDLDDASFAGMNDTILNVPTDITAVCDAIKQCWSSLFSKRAIVYRQENGFPMFATSIAVVVQVMIPSDASGVVFTTDPQSGSRGLISLDGVQGMGEALVSGMVNTDHWTIRKSYGSRKMKVEETILGQQAFKLVSKYPAAGTEKVVLDEKEGRKPSFDETEIAEICHISCSIERYYVKPMDIEFCFYKHMLFVLQARPITHLISIPDNLNPLTSHDNRWAAWVSFNNVQMLTEPMSPCGVSVFRSLVGCSESEYRYYKNSIKLSSFKEVFHTFQKPLLFNLIRHVITCPSATVITSIMETTLGKYIDRIDVLRSQMDDDTSRSFLSKVLTDKIDITDIVPTCLPALIYSIITTYRIRKIVKKYGMKSMDAEVMWGNQRKNKANLMNHSVMRLTICLRSLIKDDTQIADIVTHICTQRDNEKTISLIDSFRQSDNEKQKMFASEWDTFMSAFGRRGPSEIDIASPRYEQRPVMLLCMIMNLDSTGYKNEEAGDKEREEKTEHILSQLSKRDRKKVEKLLPVAQCFLTYREHPKYLVISYLQILRRSILRVGEKMVQKGVIDKADDVFMLSLEEITPFDSGIVDGLLFRSIIKTRREIDVSGHAQQPPRVIIGPECIMKSISNETKSSLNNLPPNVIKGVATSAGIVEGIAVVATDPDTAIVMKGSILIAMATDPGWTPLFLPAAGVAIEIGGPLTHGSVVAREMGIPCVVGAHNITKQVRTGMKVRIDGYKGTVEILE